MRSPTRPSSVSLTSGLVAFAMMAPVGACSSCKKPPPADTTPEASVDPAPAASASAAPEAGASAAASAAPGPSAAPAASGGVAAKPAAGGPWSGVYKCLNHLTLTQNGNSVIGHTKTGADEDTSTCTISGDVCTGTESRVHHPKGKPPVPGKTRKLTLKRDANGTVHYNAEGNALVICPK